MRILHIFDHSIPLHSGYTFRSQAIVTNQRALGWQTEHITSTKHNMAAGKQQAQENVDGLDFFRTPYHNGFLSRLPLLNQWAVVRSLERRLAEVVKQVKPDILHAHSPALNGIAAVRVARHLGYPLLYEIRAFWEDAAVDHGTSKEGGVRYRMTRALESYVIKKADYVTTICEGLRRDIIERGVSEDKVVVIPNAVDLDKFSLSVSRDDDLLNQLGLTGKTVLGFIGSFYAYEGLPLLIRALPLIMAKNSNVRLLLVGGGPQDQQLKALTKSLGLDDKVIFTGRVPHDQVQKYYDMVDIFVYPRLSMRLTELVTPLKPLEAMARGRLVVASDVGGHKELIDDGVTGVLFAAGDAQALAGAVLGLLDRQDEWQLQKNQARNFVEQERNWPVSVARYKPVYEAMIKK